LVSQQPIQPLVDEVVKMMQYSTDPTLLLEVDMFTNHVFFVTISKPFEQGGIPLT
jgi:hypothetical protein